MKNKSQIEFLNQNDLIKLNNNDTNSNFNISEVINDGKNSSLNDSWAEDSNNKAQDGGSPSRSITTKPSRPNITIIKQDSPKHRKQSPLPNINDQESLAIPDFKLK